VAFTNEAFKAGLFQTFFLPVLLQIIRVFNFHEDQGRAAFTVQELVAYYY